jgi:alpha-ketoglutarate-dependent taurine dioxygenase
MSSSAAVLDGHSDGLTVTAQQPRIGAEVAGIDLRVPLTAENRDKLRNLLNKYKVLFFRDQQITREQHIAFGREFGELDIHPIVQVAEAPVVQPISARRFHKYAGSGGGSDKRYINRWHTDETFRAIPPLASILRAVHLPELGGDTVFADATAAYEGLSDEVKERIANLRAVHSAAYGFGWYENLERKAEIERQYPPVEHSVVRVHPETGAKVLFVNSAFTSHIIGLEKEESDRLLAHLLSQFVQPEYQVRFKWRPGSIAFWDNRATQHYGVWDFGDATRELERVTIKGQSY